MSLITDTKINFSFLPINILTNWERASLSANFFSEFLAKSHNDIIKDSLYKNTVSTLINEIIEYSVKHSTFKKDTNNLSICIKNNTLQINIQCDLLKSHLYLLKVLLRNLNSNKKASIIDNFNFSGDFSSIIFSIFTLIKNYKAAITVKKIKPSKDPLSSINLQLSLKLKEEHLYDH